MTQPSPNDDPELRVLLDSIGMPQTKGLADDGLRQQRAAAELRRILKGHDENDPKKSPQLLRRLVAVGLAAAVVSVFVLIPHHSRTPTRPSTAPAMLRFSAPHGTVPTATSGFGSRSNTVIGRLAALAAAQPVRPRSLPVQEVQTYLWKGNGYPTAETTYVVGDQKFEAISQQPVRLTSGGRLQAPDGYPPVNGPVLRSTLSGASDPDRLPLTREALDRKLIEAEHCPRVTAACVLTALVRLHSTYALSPSAAANLWRGVAHLSGVTDLGVTRDRLGREAVGLSTPADTPGERLIVLADPRTGALLGAETIRGMGGASQVVAFTVINASLRIASLPHTAN